MEINNKMDIITFMGGVKTVKYAVGSIVCSIPSWIQIDLTWLNVTWLDMQHFDVFLTSASKIVSILAGIAALVNFFIQWFKKK